MNTVSRKQINNYLIIYIYREEGKEEIVVLYSCQLNTKPSGYNTEKYEATSEVSSHSKANEIRERDRCFRTPKR